ncbi:hypothetical protein PMSM_18950 [Paenibacillus macquariensis subsp. macquariensis]|uniref:Diguanylate cyclase (GGDEF) domain-containing protein n=2 Tax=Paenibacillus macquariensis TaxID=948756 RepID=A0ABY1K456_9BACL|nr:hypothetical protein PMSM_18950 [Paenibacillus macquariensis subsp. macquariensis]SIR23267.1 diguanylate cyclase (GGDEF) domain-containing protein [Paenibacillus macquariensis]
MGLMVWIDLILFIVLFALFVYVFASVTITNLHKVYLVFHFSMMLWPFCQFAIKTTDNPKIQLFYVKFAFIDATLLSIGWLLFTILLTGQLHILRKKISLLLFVPMIFIALVIIVNPSGMFVQPIHGGYMERIYGPIFWVIVTIATTYVVISLYIIYLALSSNKTARIKKQVSQVIRGVCVLTAFVLLDIFLNVVLSHSLPVVIPGLTSLGILLSAIFFVIAIHRDKIFDIVTIAHQDIIDTIGQGILVLDDNQTVVEINQSLLPHVNIHIGDRFDMTLILPPDELDGKFDVLLYTYRKQPLEKTEIELFYPNINRYITIHAAPILVSDIMVGRIITFQDMTEIHHLIDATNLQYESLQERNLELIRIQNELFQTNQKLKQMAVTDSLTGCYNRHYLTQQLEHEVIKNMKYQTPFTILIIDIDFFKSINDNYGHLVGDVVICNTVEIIKQTLRQTDILARYGGEEFIIYLPNTSQAHAKLLAERVKSAIEANKVRIDNVAHALSITISIGLLSLNNFTVKHVNNPKIHLNDMFETVDKALYQAKKEGRNRIVSIVK